MTGTMYDSTTPNEIPTGATEVAGYVAGRWPTYPWLVQHFPHAHRLSIAVASTEDADCLDIEPGDAPPERAPAWVRRQHARGNARPVIYTSVAAAGHVLALLAAAGIKRNQVRVWTAHYTKHPHLCDHHCWSDFTTTADATQYNDRALGRNLDVSMTADNFWVNEPKIPPTTVREVKRLRAILAHLRAAARAAGGWQKVPRVWQAAKHIRAAIARLRKHR